MTSGEKKRRSSSTWRTSSEVAWMGKIKNADGRVPSLQADGRVPSLRSFRGSGEEFAALAPKLTEQEMQAINGLFRAFIFKITRKGEYWTSCCRRHVILSEERTVTGGMQEILDVPHTPEPQYRYYKLLNPESETRAVCPHCGAEVTVKELGRTGRRGNLWSYRRAVVLRWHRGSLWAVGVEAP